MAAYRVHAYTALASQRVATIDVRARDAVQAREKAGAELREQGRDPLFLTLVPVEVGAMVNPFRV